ncbi:hypothetical protein [Streptomyces uncialis]|uniref:hypothetical protein n=1 Tax=Streptomyces uncialis TaxID=1048205 RepID=UPI0022563C7E|nr:hypothetical protein [Streptomyces uncialis]MCX4661510.1 hypothetical protein [Streptomyces uncialis]
MPELHPATRAVLRFFDSTHLPAHLAVIADRFQDLAVALAHHPGLDGPELTVSLRKLLEAKDAAVRSALPAGGEGGTDA